MNKWPLVAQWTGIWLINSLSTCLDLLRCFLSRSLSLLLSLSLSRFSLSLCLSLSLFRSLSLSESRCLSAWRCLSFSLSRSLSEFSFSSRLLSFSTSTSILTSLPIFVDYKAKQWKTFLAKYLTIIYKHNTICERSQFNMAAIPQDSLREWLRRTKGSLGLIVIASS